MRLANLGLACLLLPLLAPAPLKAAEAVRTELLEETPNGFTLRIQLPEAVQSTHTLPTGESYLRVTIPGFDPGSDAAVGEPDLPQTGFPFGIPDRATARVTRVRTLSTDSFRGIPPLPVPERRIVPSYPFTTQEDTYSVDSRTYASSGLFPTEVVELGPVMGWRHQRIQSVVIHPVQVVPATGDYRVIRELEVDVQYEFDLDSPRQGRRVRVMEDAPGWDEIVDKALVNPGTARTFRARSAPSAIPRVVQFGDSHVRIRLGGTGFARIRFSELSAQGFPPDTPLADVRLEERSFDEALTNPFVVHSIPRRVEDTNQNGIFDDGDFLVFYGFNYQDRFQPLIADSRFCYFHAYWLTASPGGGMEFPTTDGYPAGVYGVLGNFPSPLHEEENNIYTHNPKDAGGIIFPVFDTLYWLGSGNREGNFPFTARNLDPAGNYQVRARWQGKDLVASTREHIVSIDINGQTILDEFSFFDRFEFIWTGPWLPQAGVLVGGANTFTMRGRTVNENNRFYGAYFDWFEVTYERLFVAHDDELVFNTGSNTGDLEMVVTGFTSPDILVLDITDPLDIREMTGQVEDAGGSWTVKIRTSVGANATRTYAASVVTSDTGLPPHPYAFPPDLENQPVAPGLPRDLLAEGNGSDYILITHPLFKDAWQPLVTHRESLGHRVFVCDVWEIYDQFSGGDKTPWAIQRFLSQAFRNWDPTPSFVLLGADASEDYRTDTDESDPDWVPTMMHFANVQGTAGLELAGTDSWYVQFLREGDAQGDVLMDMHIGRIPVGSVQETQDAVQKIIAYETMDAGDDWRQRGMFLADDQYSNRIHANAPYCWQNAEASFRETSQAVCDSIKVLGRLPNFECETFFLADYLDTVASMYRDPGPDDCPVDPANPIGNMLTTTRSYTRRELTPGFLDQMDRGHLFWQFTGHANKNLITHEALVEHRPSFLSTRDLDKIDNLGKPFLFMGFACHLMEFEGSREKSEGESIGDILLLAPNRGAIAVMASTGFEWLHTNPIIQTRTTRPLFWDLPRDPNGRPRRLFGEAMTRGLVQLGIENPTRGDILGMLRTYQTFADPALRVDVEVGQISVQVNGSDWTDGTPLTSSSFTDSLAVEAEISDDVDIATIRVMEAGTELPAERLAITPPGASDQGAQFYQVGFKSLLSLGDYDLVIESADWAGRTSSFTMPVDLEVVFKADEATLAENGVNPVDPSSNVSIEVQSAVPIEVSSFRVLVDGRAITPGFTEVSPTQWLVEVGSGWDVGEHTVELQLQHPSAECVPGPCPITRSVTISPGDAIAIEDIFFYPNPVESVGGKLVYTLNRNATEGEISIYSVSGRRLLRRQLAVASEARAGTNSIAWDLKDEAGDEVANGIYLLVLTVQDANGKSVTTRSDPERIAVTR